MNDMETPGRLPLGLNLGLFMLIAGGGLVWAVRGKEEVIVPDTPRELLNA